MAQGIDGEYGASPVKWERVDDRAVEPVEKRPGVDINELVKLGAVATEFFCQEFFPKTFRQASPPFAGEFWEPLENPNCRLVNQMLFRGASKTTRLRAFAAKRISYGVSRTVLFIGSSERDAIRSVTWLKHQVERNHHWRSAFNLKKGGKWEETQIELEHGTFGHTVWVLGAGITGSLRGINFDDYRPDLIIVDDPQTDEMASSLEQREKTSDLLFGAVKNSLAPAVDEPNAKLVMAITPQHPDDISQQALRDPQWTSRVFPCWTKETLGLDVEQQVSIWEERFPTKELRADKLAAIARNKLSIFSREMECRLITPESSVFLPTWLQIRESGIEAPLGGMTVLAIDPVPPPSPREMEKGLQGKDWECHYVWRRVNGQYHLVDCARNRGHDPSWTVATAFGLLRRYGCHELVFEAVAYQRVLKWIFEKEMQRRRLWYPMVPVGSAGEKKYARITSVLNPLATNGLLYVGAQHSSFIEQFNSYGPTYGGPDDDLDASAIALKELTKPWLEEGRAGAADSDVEELEPSWSCP